MNKHAYLIMAHNNYELLNKLLSVLDDIRNDIYLHIDAKDTSFNMNKLVKLKNSEISLVNRRKIFWGGYSQTKCELDLLRAAVQNEYSYYHLLSGADFPIKNQDYIHRFFATNSGSEFLGFDNRWNKKKIQYHYLFTDVGRDKKPITLLKKIINRLAITFQKIIRYSKKYDIQVYKGANWFSITHELVTYTLEKSNLIERNFAHILNSDEFFLQSIVANSGFSKRVFKGIDANEYDNNLRHIDWKRGEPYSFKIEDLDELLASDRIFARKFDGKNGMNVVNKLYNIIMEEKT
jgi:hypothetical protein